MNKMKKICLLVLIMVLGKLSFSQGYPVTQYIGTDSAVVISRGAMQSRLVNYVYTDTTQANTQRIKAYPGAQIVTTNGGTNFILWIRNQNATRWLQIPAGSGVGNIYTVDGTLTGNRTLLGANNSLTFNQINNLLFGADTTTVTNDGVATLNVKGAIGRVLLVDTTAPADERIYEIKSNNGEFFISKINDIQTLQDSTFYISSGGNIGINTFSPGAKLGVNGNTFVKGQLFAGDTALSTYQVEGILTTPYVLGRKAVDTTLSTQARPTGVQGHVVGRGPIANRLQGGTFYATTDSASTANSTGSLRASNSWSAHNGSGSLANAWGSYNIVQNKTTGTITNAYGSVSGVENRGATSTINKLQGSTTEVWNNYGGTIDTAWGQVISIYNNNASSNIGAVYGLSIGRGLITPTGGTHFWRNAGTIGSSYGIYLDSAIDVGTNRFALYSNSNSDSYLKGNIGLGTTTPGGRLAIVDTGGFALKINYNSASTDANNNAALYAENNGLSSYVAILNEKTTNNTGGQFPILIESSLTSGTAQSGMATGIHFGVPDDAGNKKVTQLALRTTDPAAATYTNRAELRLWNAGSLSTPYYLLGNGNMGLGTSTPDSNLTVVNGALFQRGVRMSALPQAPGTKALRIDASGTISYADTLIDAGGTVTSVATNNGTGITGGTITTTGTLAIDTLLISTRAWRQKGVDSLQANINLKLNISDTASMLSPYLKKADTTAMLNPYFRLAGVGLKNTGQTVYADTLLLSTRAWRQKGVDSVSALINSNVSGTTNYVAKFTGSNTIGNSQIFDNGTNVGIGITPSASIFNQLQVQYAVLMGNSSDATANYLGSNFYLGAGAQWKYIASNQASQFAQTSGGFNWNTAPVGTAGNNLTWTTRMQLTNSGLLGVGTSFIDSNLTVGLGTHLKRGVRMSALPTGVGTKAVRIDANGTLSVADTLTNGVSGSLTANFIPKATGTTTLNNSPLSVGSGVVGLGLGVVPPNSWSNYWALQLANGVSLASYNYADIPIGWLGTNAYHDGIGDIRVSNGAANKYLQDRGNHKWYVAGYGTSGSYISWTQSMLLDTLNRLTIGTTIPDSMFNVAEGVHFERGVRMSGLPSGVGIKSLRVDANGTVSLADTLANGISGTGTTNYIPKFTSSSAIGNSLVYDNGTTVAIGNTANGTGYALEIATNASTPRIDLVDNGVYTGQLKSNSGIAYFQNLSSNALVLGTAGSERLRISSTGNVSIGNTNNTYKLDVSGQGIFRLTAAGAGITLENTSTNNIFTTYSNASNNTYIGLVDNNGVVQTNNSFEVYTGASYTKRLTIDASGNLGLGVSPSAWASGFTALQVKNASFWSTGNDASITANAYYDGSNYRYIGTAGASRTYHNIDGSINWYQAPSGTAGNTISFTQAMTLNASGNLSIGNTNDTYKLDVSGTGRFSSDVAISGSSGVLYSLGQLGFTNTGAGGQYGIYTLGTGTPIMYFDHRATGNTGQWVWRSGTGGATTALTLSNAGAATFSSSVTAGGIVSSATEFRLNNQTYSRVATLGSGGDFGGGYNFNWVNGSPVHAETGSISGYGYGNDGSVRFYSNSSQSAGVAASERMRITSGGDVGIGTTSPAAKLTVLGNISLGNRGSAGTSYIGKLREDDGGITNAYGIGFVNSDINGAGYINFYTSPVGGSGDTRMTILGSGNVGIGTTSPAYNLDVSGRIRAYTASSGVSPRTDLGGTIIAEGSTRAGLYILTSGTAAGSFGSIWWGNGNTNTDASITVANDTRAMAFGTADGERMRITSGGELLVNTTSDAGDYKLQVNGNGYFTGSGNTAVNIRSTADFPVLQLTDARGLGQTWNIENARNAYGELGFYAVGLGNQFTLSHSTGNATFGGSIKTAAPSGGTAKPFKIGAAATVTPTSPNRTIEIEIDGVTYYLTAKTTND